MVYIYTPNAVLNPQKYLNISIQFSLRFLANGKNIFVNFGFLINKKLNYDL